MWKEYNNLVAERLAALVADGVPAAEAMGQARQYARVEIERRLAEQRQPAPAKPKA